MPVINPSTLILFFKPQGCIFMWRKGINEPAYLQLLLSALLFIYNFIYLTSLFSSDLILI